MAHGVGVMLPAWPQSLPGLANGLFQGGESCVWLNQVMCQFLAIGLRAWENFFQIVTA